jgi:hypothetical protein
MAQYRIRFQSLLRNFDGKNNVAGYNAQGYSSSGSFNIAVGSHALYNNRIKNLVAIGDSAMFNTGIDAMFNGDDNIAALAPGALF